MVKRAAGARTAIPASATGNVGYDRAYLYAHGWRERSCAGPWRWELKRLPGAWYTLHDAVALQRSMDKRVEREKK